MMFQIQLSSIQTFQINNKIYLEKWKLFYKEQQSRINEKLLKLFHFDTVDFQIEFFSFT